MHGCADQVCVSHDHPGRANIRSCAQGSAHSRFSRAVDRREVFQAEAAARELARLSLNDALSLVCLYATAGSPKFDPAAVRWLARLGLEEPEVTLTTMQLAADALVQLHGHDHEEARQTLLRLLWAAANVRKS